MPAATIDELYERQIKALPADERLRLLARIAADLVNETPAQPRKRSSLELEGLGAELWQGIDAQDCVNKLREEWYHRP